MLEYLDSKYVVKMYISYSCEHVTWDCTVAQLSWMWYGNSKQFHKNNDICYYLKSLLLHICCQCQPGVETRKMVRCLCTHISKPFSGMLYPHYPKVIKLLCPFNCPCENVDMLWGYLPIIITKSEHLQISWDHIQLWSH